jgi:CheY-like chemotaxis protein
MEAKVLVVDDNPDAAQLLGEILTDHGHRVRVALSGPEALSSIGSFQPDAALLDLGLPIMDGFELAVNLRARIPGIRLVALTGWANDHERTRAAGFDAHLLKPVSIARVTATLEALLRGT